MIKEVIRLIEPGLFLPCFAVEPEQRDKVLVRPRFLSICAADQRYFQGNRPPSVLAQKLPLALFHEAVGEVLYDPKSVLKKGTYCILLPGGAASIEKYSNYQAGAFFRSSNADGFCQELLYMDEKELIPIDHEPAWPYVLTELMSVCCQAISKLCDLIPSLDGKSMGIWGDGSMAYMMAITAKNLFPNSPVYVFGKHDEKLINFSFCDKRININDNSDHTSVDIAFDCVGGNGSQLAIAQAIDKVVPTGFIVLMGVSEIPPVVNTRMILEKGLNLLGCSRSVYRDFIQAKKLIDKPEVKNSLNKIISKRCQFRTATELSDIFIEDKSLPYKTIIYKQF